MFIMTHNGPRLWLCGGLRRRYIRYIY